MDRHAQKVFLAVAIGVGLGILTGRAIGGAFAWMLGAVLGGVSAYILFAPIAALRAIPRAYRAARGWHLSSEQWEEVRWTIYAILAPYTLALVPSSMIVWLDRRLPHAASLGIWMDLAATCFLATMFTVFIGGFAFCFAADAKRREAPTGADRLWMRRYVATNVLWPVFLFWHCPRFLWLAATVAIPVVARFAWKWFRHWLRLVHSDLRMICLADAFLFAGIGTLVGGPILAWMVGGGAFGVLNYHVVSVRWLKLQPVRSAK